MKLQAVMNRSVAKQGTDLSDIVRLTFDEATRPVALAQIGHVDVGVARDMAMHVDLWFKRNRRQSIRWIRDSGGDEVTVEDLDLVAELLLAACER